MSGNAGAAAISSDGTRVAAAVDIVDLKTTEPASITIWARTGQITAHRKVTRIG